MVTWEAGLVRYGHDFLPLPPVRTWLLWWESKKRTMIIRARKHFFKLQWNPDYTPVIRQSASYHRFLWSRKTPLRNNALIFNTPVIWRNSTRGALHTTAHVPGNAPGGWETGILATFHAAFLSCSLHVSLPPIVHYTLTALPATPPLFIFFPPWSLPLVFFMLLAASSHHLIVCFAFLPCQPVHFVAGFFC